MAFNFNAAAELFPAAIRRKKRAGFAYRDGFLRQACLAVIFCAHLDVVARSLHTLELPPRLACVASGK